MKNDYNQNTFNDVNDFQQTINNTSLDRISVNLNLITACLIQFPDHFAVPDKRPE